MRNLKQATFPGEGLRRSQGGRFPRGLPDDRHQSKGGGGGIGRDERKTLGLRACGPGSG